MGRSETDAIKLFSIFSEAPATEKASVFAISDKNVPVISVIRVGLQVIGLPGNTNYGGRLSTIDLLIKVASFVRKENNIFNIKMS